MASPRKVSIVWVWLLLAVLLSYSFDVECLIETQSCAQGIVHVEPTSDCAQPGLAPAPVWVAILFSPPEIRVPAPRVHSPVASLWKVDESPPERFRSVPLGLRAPPQPGC